MVSHHESVVELAAFKTESICDFFSHFFKSLVSVRFFFFFKKLILLFRKDALN